MNAISRIYAAIARAFRVPYHLLIVFGLRLHVRWRGLFGPDFFYTRINGDANEIRVIQTLPPLTSFPHWEPLRCNIKHISLNDFTEEYRDWEKEINQIHPKLLPRKKTRKWLLHRNALPNSPTFSRFSWGDYCAISYVWGSSIRDSSIILNGCAFFVPKSVEFVLQAARPRKYEIEKPIWFWIDFLSINQDDELEKGEQILRMREIYQGALDVVANIGPEKEESWRAGPFIQDLAQRWRASQKVKENKTKPEGEAGKESDDNTGGLAYNGRTYGSQDLLAVFKVFMRPYWTRLWVIQELAMADDASFIYCGNWILSLVDLRMAMKLLHEDMVATSMLLGDQAEWEKIISAVGLLWYLGRLRSQMEAWQEGDQKVSYAQLRAPALRLAQMAKATLEYDNVIGMLGLLPNCIAKEMEDLVKRAPGKGCGKDEMDEYVREVFIAFAVAIIRATGELDIIYARHSSQDSASKFPLPTWVPDWTLGYDRSDCDSATEWEFLWEDPYSTDLDTGLSTVDTSGEDTVLRADGGRTPKIEFNEEKTLLHVQAIRVGVIASLAPEAFPSDPTLPSPLPNQRALRIPYYTSVQALRSAFLRTILLDSQGSHAHLSTLVSLPWITERSLAEIQEEDPAFDFLALVQKLKAQGWDEEIFAASPFLLFDSCRHALRDFGILVQEDVPEGAVPSESEGIAKAVFEIMIKDLFPEIGSPCPDRPPNHDFEVVVANLAARKLITMEAGQLGLAPRIARERDQVWVVLGCRMPVILREEVDEMGSGVGSWKVVGECFVDGLMDGQVVRDMNDGQCQLEELSLC